MYSSFFGTHIHRRFGDERNAMTILVCRNVICLARLDIHFYFVSTYSRNTQLQPPLYEPGTTGSVRIHTEAIEISMNAPLEEIQDRDTLILGRDPSAQRACARLVCGLANV